MANSRLHNHTYSHMWSRRNGPHQYRTPADANYPEQSHTNLIIPAPTNTHFYPPIKNWIHPSRKDDKEEKNNAGPQDTQKKGPSLNKSLTTHKNSLWRMRTVEILKEYNLTEDSLSISKQGLGKALDIMNKQMTTQEISKEANKMTKTRHLMENKGAMCNDKRPKYMTHLSRNQCHAILMTRSSMIPVKANQKARYQGNMSCRFCKAHQEDQKHIMTEWVAIPHKVSIPYEELFRDNNWKTLKEAAENINLIIECLLATTNK